MKEGTFTKLTSTFYEIFSKEFIQENIKNLFENILRFLLHN